MGVFSGWNDRKERLDVDVLMGAELVIFHRNPLPCQSVEKPPFVIYQVSCCVSKFQEVSWP